MVEFFWHCEKLFLDGKLEPNLLNTRFFFFRKLRFHWSLKLRNAENHFLDWLSSGFYGLPGGSCTEKELFVVEQKRPQNFTKTVKRKEKQCNKHKKVLQSHKNTQWLQKLLKHYNTFLLRLNRKWKWRVVKCNVQIRFLKKKNQKRCLYVYFIF